MATRYVREEDELAYLLKRTRRGLSDVQSPTGTERAQTSLIAQSALDLANLIESERTHEAEISSLIPKAPSGLAVASNVGNFTPAGPVATVVVEWNPVTESTTSKPVEVVEYELWDTNGPLVRVPSPTAMLSFASELVVELRVRARADRGGWGDLSATLSVTAAIPAVATDVPSSPELYSSMGLVVARWDGTYTTGGTAGNHAVVVESRVGAGSWTPQGAVLTAAGGTTFEGVAGDLVEVRLRAYDQLGRHTGTSGVVSVTVAAIGGDDLDADDIWANEAWLNKLRAGVIEVDMLRPNVGDTLNLTGNAVTILLNDRQDALGIAISQNAEAVGDAAETAAAAALAASQAQAEVSALAAGRVLSAEQAVAVLSGKLDAYENSFSFESDGLHIRESAAAQAEMLLTSAGARLIANGVTVSEWNQGQFIVSQIVAMGGRLGNHIIDSSLAGHTTFRQA